MRAHAGWKKRYCLLDAVVVGCEISDMMKAFTSALFRDELESGKFTIAVKNLATVDVLGMCLYASPFRGLLYSYRRGL